MKLSQLRNNKNPTSLNSIDFKVSIHYTLGDLLPEQQPEWSDRLSAYNPNVSSWIYGKCVDFQNTLSSYIFRRATGGTRRMSYYKIYYHLTNTTPGYTKLSRFKH